MCSKTLLNSKEISIILHRLACQLIENHDDFNKTVLIGLQPKGVFLANRLIKLLKESYGILNLQTGELDITFFRDDFRIRDQPLVASSNNMEVSVENKKVVLIDDVLFSGRSINVALTAIQSYGRASEIQLLVLIDRRFSRHFPIQPNYVGSKVDVIENERVNVHWREKNDRDVVMIIKNQK